MSRVSWGFEDIVKGGISIPVTCMGDRMYYGIYVPLSKMPEGGGATAAEQQAPMTQRKLVFHSYSGFERLASSMSGLGGPKFPGSKIVTAHRKEDFTQYLNDLREFLSGKKVAARNEFMAFVSKGSIPTHDAIGLIKAQREQDRTEVADMLSFIKEIPSSYSWTKPLICFFGYESSGKSSLINVLWGMNFRKSTQTDIGYTIIESMPESEFAKLCTGYAYRSLSRDQIISQSEELEREGLVYIELDTNATLCRYKNELGCVRQKIEKSGSLLRTVVINERYLQQAVDAETFRALQKVTVLDSYGINSVNIKDDTLKEVTTFFLRDCTLAAILCSEKNVTAAAGMYKFFCECATSAYMSKEQLKKKIMESIKSEGSDAGDGSLILTAVMTCAKFIAPNLYGLAEYFIKPSSSSSSSKSSSGSDGNKSNGNADNGGIAQSASVLSNILFCVTMLDEYETFERKAYEFGLRLGKCFESPPTFDNCFFISLKEGSRGRENCEELLGSLKRYVCKINPNRAKDDSIKAMLEKLSDKGFMYVDIEKKKAIETHVNERLEMWKLGFSI